MTADVEQANPPAQAASEPADDDGTAFILFARDGLDAPISDLQVTVDLPDGTSVTRTTDSQGAMTVPVQGPMTGKADVSVKDLAAKQQKVCSIDLERCGTAVIVRSPKVLSPIKFELHQGTPAKPAPARAPASAASTPSAQTPTTSAASATTSAASATDPWWLPALDKACQWLDPIIGDTPLMVGDSSTPHVVARARNLEGNPVTVIVGPECPNKDGLRLGENNLYRQAILDAGKRVSIDPRAIATLIDAEAAKEPIVVTLKDAQGKPILFKTGKKKGQPQTIKTGTRWKADSAAGTSAAVGLTQFVPGTWLNMAMKPGTYLNNQCKAKGWVYEADVVKTVQGRQEHRSQWQFKLSNGNSTYDPSQASCLGDANVQACLALRTDPTCSIMTAADYAVENLAAIASARFKVDGLSDAEKAKLMYLMHHEGGTGGISFLRNSCSYTEHQLARQAGAEGAKKWIAAVVAAEAKAAKVDKPGAATSEQVTKAYRAWLANYIYTTISLGHFSCQPIASNPSLIDVAKKIGAPEIVYFEPPK